MWVTLRISKYVKNINIQWFRFGNTLYWVVFNAISNLRILTKELFIKERYGKLIKVFYTVFPKKELFGFLKTNACCSLSLKKGEQFTLVGETRKIRQSVLECIIKIIIEK